MPPVALTPCDYPAALVPGRPQQTMTALRCRAGRRRRPTVKPLVMQVYIDKFEILKTPCSCSSHTGLALAELWPDVPEPAGPQGLGQKSKRWLKRLWPILALMGNCVAFVLGRVGIGLRFEDIQQLLSTRRP